MLDILFVNPNSSEESYQGLAKRFSAIEVPTWSLLLAGSCLSKNISCEILDCDAERLTDEAAIEKILEIKPRLVVGVVYGQNPSMGIYAVSGLQRLFEKLKLYSDIKTGIVGTYVSASPSECLSYNCFDFGFIGDGVYSLQNLIKTDLKTDLHKINGLVYKQDGFVQINAPEKVVPQDLLDTDLPEYPWHLIDLSLYRAHNWHANYIDQNRSPFVSIYTSLGCVKKCQFCVINLVNRTDYSEGVTSANSNFMRFWSPEKVLSWLDKISELGIRNVRFSDELFYLNRRYYEPILDGIIERGYDINSWVYARCDTVKYQHLEKFKKAGVNYIALGIESSSRNIRRENDKGGMEDVDVKEIIKTIEGAGIEVAANYMVGFPNETMEDMQNTLDFAIEMRTAFMNVYTTTYFPGTPLYEEAKRSGIRLPQKFDEYAFLGYNYVPMDTKYVTGPEVLRFRDKFWAEYFSNQHVLNNIEQKFGSAAKQHLLEQALIPIRRKVLGD